jgi:hypothetical protein
MQISSSTSELFEQSATMHTLYNKSVHSYTQSNCTRRGCTYDSCIWTPDCWLEVSVHPEGPTQNSKIPAKTQHSQCHTNFVITPPPKHTVQPKSYASFLPCTRNSPLPITELPSLPNVLPCQQNTFTRRTSGHCLGTFGAANFCHSSIPFRS